MQHTVLTPKEIRRVPQNAKKQKMLGHFSGRAGKNKQSGHKVNLWQIMFSLPIPRDQGENLDVPTILKVLGHSAALSDDKVAWAKKEEYQS